MIAVDTNILLYAHRSDSPWHEPADACMATLAESRAAWAIPWRCFHEFLAIATHPRIFDPPTTGITCARSSSEARYRVAAFTTRESPRSASSTA